MFRKFSFHSTRSRESQSRYLSHAIQLEESVNPVIVRATMVAVSGAILAFLVWAAVTNINEVARTPGEVVPQGFQQVVQHLEGGIVREIRVKEGEQVQKGQIVLTLDGTGAREDLARAMSRQVSLDMQEERLRAFTAGRTADFSAYDSVDPSLARDNRSFFEGMTQSRDEERKVIAEQIQQKRRMITTLRADMETARANRAIAQDLYERRRVLNERGYTSDIRFLETRQNLNDIEGEIRNLGNRISIAQAEIKEFESRLTSLDARYNDQTNERLSLILSEKAQNAEMIEKLKDRVARLDVRSPANGIVKGLGVNTVGSVVQPGQTLMEVVPLDENLIVHVKIPPQHIGHVRAGQDVQVKFSSFDFSRYGVVSGKLDQISAMTFAGDRGERFYQGLIHLDRGYVGRDTRNAVVPGMTVMAEIITGRKTVLDYLLKPIHVAMKTAFTER